MPPIAIHDPTWWLTALRVYIILHFMAFAAWPWFTRLFRTRPDRGAGLAMAGGIFIYLLAAQLWWRTGLFDIRLVWAMLLMACVGLCGRQILFKPDTPSFGTRARMRKSFSQGWVVFSMLFWYWAGIRTCDPGVSHTEQPMDLMWMRAAVASSQPPIRDAWFGGEPASYYSDGHQALALLGVKMGLPIQESVNLTQIIWFALTGLLVFQAGKMLYALSRRQGDSLAGLLSLLFVLFVSTPMGFISVLKPEGSPWWWKASRVLQDGDTELITEFPFFSFWLGDNHAHMIGLPFLLLAILSALSLFRARKIYFSNAILPVLLVFWSWRINPWQVPTVTALPVIALWIRKRKLSYAEVQNIVLAGLPGLLMVYPARNGGPAMELVLNRKYHTNIMEALKVFGFFIPGLLIILLMKCQRFWIYLLCLILGMFLCAEVLFLNDLFHNRMNTVFKVYYQIWILAGLLTAVGLTAFVNRNGNVRFMKRTALFCMIAPGLAYAGKLTLEAWASPYRSLNAWSRLASSDQSALYIANKLIQPGDRIAEAPGDSYDPNSSKFSTWTAGNSIIGWRGHEQQWRPGVPHPDLAKLYEAPSKEALMLSIQQLDLDWIVIGERERDLFRIPAHWESWLIGISYRVVDQEEQRVYRLK